MYYDFYLSHGGPGSGRYPLGSGDRPYQHKGWLAKRRQKKIQQKAAKIAQERKRQQEEAARREFELEANRQRALSSGNAAQILQYQGRLSNAELKAAVERLGYEKSLRAYVQEDMASGMKNFDRLMGKVKTYNGWVNTGIEVWNNVAAIYNAVDPEANFRKVNKGNDGGGGSKKK